MRRALRNKASNPASGPLVSVVVSSYNYQQYIGQTIESVLSQTYPNLELIVSDDCSTDNSLEVIRAFRDDRITLLTNDTNTRGRHVSEAYVIAQGKYLCSLDSDDFIAPDKIEKQVRFLEDHPGVDVLGTFIVEVDAEGKATGDKNGHEAWFNRDIDLNQLESWMWRNHLANSSVLMRKALHDKIGPLNRDFFITADYDYWTRCLVQKAVFHVLPEKLTYYRYHGSNVSHNDAERVLLEFAYIFSSTLAPYAIETGRVELAVDTILELPAHNLGLEVQRNVKSYLLSGLMSDRPAIGLSQFLEKLKEEPRTEEFIASAIADKFISTIEKQSEKDRELEQTKSWLEDQRAKWETEAERGAQSLNEQHAWIRKLEEARDWLEEERAKWQTEAERVAQVLEKQAEWIGQIEHAKLLLVEQRDKWQTEAERGTQLLGKQRESIDELEQAKSVLAKERARWQTEAERGAQLLEKQRERVDELEQARSVLEEQRAKWQTEAERGANLLEKQSERIHELDQSKSSLEEQLANKTRGIDELQATSRLLDEAKEYSLSQIEVKDLIMEGQHRLIEAKKIELASWERELALTDEELIKIKYSKLQRLKDSILHDALSFRKLVRISYLLTALATPKYLRQRLKPVEQKLKQRFKAGSESIDTDAQQSESNREKPLVSVIIPCFNHGRYVEEAIDSVLAQTFQSLEIIVVEGGSTDGETPTILRSLRKPKTKVHFRKGGQHLLGDNRNFGITKARGKYICCLDADDKLKPTYIEKALFLLETGHYDLISTSLELFGDEQGFWYLPKTPSLDGIVKANQFTTVAVFRKELWGKAGGYHDTGLGKDLIYEDWDFWVRLMALGARATNIAEPLMLYRRVGETSQSRHPEIRSMDEQAQAIVAFNQKYLQPAAFQNSRERNNLQIDRGSYADLLDERRLLKDRTRVLFALPFVMTGGADTVLLPIAKKLAAHGFDISLLTTIKADASFGDNTARYQAITNEIYHLYNFLDDETAWKEFIFYLIEAKAIDIIFIAGCAFIYDLLPEIKQKFPDVKIFDQLFNEFGHLPRNREYASLIDFNFVANETVEDVLINQYGEAPQKTRVIVHGVDAEEEFNPENIDTSAVLATGQIPTDKLIISFIGRFSEEKRPEMFVEIAHALRGLEQVHFVMLGHGPEYNRVKQMIRELGLEDKFYAPGVVVDVKPLLKLTDILVIPSRIEGIPLVLMEALALGVPVVASDVGGIPSVLRNNETGFVCDRDRIEDFIQSVWRLWSDPSLRAKMKTNARPYALEHLSIRKNTAAYLEVFQRFSPQPSTKRHQENLRAGWSFKLQSFLPGMTLQKKR